MVVCYLHSYQISTRLVHKHHHIYFHKHSFRGKDILPNTRNVSPNDTAPHPSRTELKATPLCAPQISLHSNITISISVSIHSATVQLLHAHRWTSRSQSHITVNCESASEDFTLWERLQCWVGRAIWGTWSTWLLRCQNVLRSSSGCCTIAPAWKANSWRQQRTEMAIIGRYCYYETSELHDLWIETSELKIKVKWADEFIYW